LFTRKCVMEERKNHLHTLFVVTYPDAFGNLMVVIQEAHMVLLVSFGHNSLETDLRCHQVLVDWSLLLSLPVSLCMIIIARE